MKTSRVGWIYRLFLVTSLLAGLSFSGPSAAARPVALNDSTGRPASAGLQPADANPFTIPEVPVGAGSPKVNGACDMTEYAGGFFKSFTDGPSGTGTGSVYLIHDANTLYMCITSPVGSDKARFDSLYLDPQGDGGNYAQQDDFALQLNLIGGGMSTYIGNGQVNGWQDVSNADNGLWSGAASTGNFDVAEYSFPLANFNINVCSTIFGLAGYHHWFDYTGDDYGWPSNQYFDQPGTWQPVVLGSSTCSHPGSIAYVYRSNSNDATSFDELLTKAGYTVTLVPLGDVLTTDFSKFDMTIIADDTGGLDEWGTPPAATIAAAQVAQIIAPNKPILGLREGGYAFFGRLSLFIGWPMGWHGPQNFLTRAAASPAAIFNGVSADPVQYYTNPSNNVGIFIRPSTPLPADVTPAALEYPADDHASLIQQGCRMLWGNSGSPNAMTSTDGTLLFLNTVAYTQGMTCPEVPPPPQDCGYTVEKTALPASGSLVTPGTTIQYTLTYQLIAKQGCPDTGELVDVVPPGTVFVPGSASDDTSPGADGGLIWTVGTSSSKQTKVFSVQVMDTACTNFTFITNVVELRPTAATPLASAPTTHTLDCQPVNQPGSVAYVYRSNSNDATSFDELLTKAGYIVTLVPLGDVLTTDFSKFDMTIIADDTGSLNEWGTPPAATTAAAQVTQIIAPNKPILGLGEGGYAFFGRLSLFIGWPMGWHGPQNFLTRATASPAAIFNGVSSDPVQYYTDPSNNVGIFIRPSTPLPADVTPAALEYPADDHASLIQQGCRMLWGNSGSPNAMTSTDGTLLFLNTVAYTQGMTCPEVPPQNCNYTVEKTALPASGSLVAPGTVIQYTLTYQLFKQQGCPDSGKLVDVVPSGTVYVPGSASDGISPGADGGLTWTVGSSSSVQTRKLSVQVMDTACTGNKIITNVAELRPNAATPLASTPTSHTVDCPPISLPNTQPMFAEDELKVTPYPLVVGTPTHLSVRVHNLTSASLPVTVQFQVAPAATPLGVGLNYSSVASASATLPGSGTAVLEAAYVPDTSGNRCFQALVSTPGMATPLTTQSCLDLTEDFHPGQLDQLVFVVHNNTSSARDYAMVVDNTCPGWAATVVPGTISSLAAGASQNVSLSVTPPNPLTLGSGCHIDVQVWSGSTLVGGVRKLDLSPVHLPTNIIPPYEEKEISFNPDPPVAGVPGQICIQLQNPLSTSKVVTVNFSVADFGAGIPFTPAASLTDITLPPHSLNTYCAAWTPATGGTLHRCVLATLVQSGSMDQVSQHNIDIIHPASRDLSGLVIPFMVGNTGPAARQLGFDINLVGINPFWMPTILTPAGGKPPASLPAGGQVSLVLRFGVTGSASIQPSAFPSEYRYGSDSSVEVTVLLDGIPESGFAVSLEPIRLFLPLVRK